MTDREEVVRQTYHFVHDHVFPDFRVADPSRVRGAIDLHTHAGPGRQHPLELAQLASTAGMRALVLKDTVLGPTVEMVRVLNPIVQAWATERELEAAELMGSMCLGHDTGGFRPEYASRMVEAGARVIWFPTRDAANHLERARGIDRVEAQQAGLTVFHGDDLSAAVKETLVAIRDAGGAVSFGHLSRDEILALAEYAHAQGISKAFVDHPFSTVANMTVDDMVRVARLGVTVNFTMWELSAYLSVSAPEMVAAIREVGVSNCTLSSDSAYEILPSAVEAMRLHKTMLDAFGFSEEDQDLLLGGNQRRLLGIDG